jgi:hypothetical protein
MTTALAVAKEALRLWNLNHPGASLDQQCQRFSGYYWSWADQGTEAGIRTYASARAAYKASHIEGADINSAPVGTYIYFAVDPYDHIGNVVGHDNGRAVVVWATRHGDTIAELGNGVKLSHADTYPHRAYGWSHTNGANRPTSGLTEVDAPTPPPTPTPVPPSPTHLPTPDPKPTVADPIPTPAPDPVQHPATPPLTREELAAYVATLNLDAKSLDTTDANATTPLSGLFAGHPIARRRVYLGYALAVLLVSFAPDVVTAGLLTGTQVPVFVSGVTLTTSILLKLGAALGFVAASNAGKS